MQKLKEKILDEGLVLSDKVLKVDSFLNHQVDPALMKLIGEEFVRRFSNKKITKVLTLESSGIGPALMTAYILGVPMIFARKNKSITLQQDLLTATIYSYTKQVSNEVTISKKYLTSEDNVLIIDDFLANGDAAMGLIRLVEQSDAKIVGLGFVIEKTFQQGASKLLTTGYQLESLAKIESLKDKQIKFVNEEVTVH